MLFFVIYKIIFSFRLPKNCTFNGVTVKLHKCPTIYFFTVRELNCFAAVLQSFCYSSSKEGDEEEDNPQNVFNYNPHEYREGNNSG